MSRRLLLGLLTAVVLPIAVPAAPAYAANVTVRVEGAAQTLLPRTAVQTTATPVNKTGVPGQECPGTSAAGALEAATRGAWTGPFTAGLGYFAATILGETPAGADFFTFWVNNREAQVGLCGVELQEGDEVLFFVASCVTGPPPDFLCTNPPVLPLGLTVPATAAPGAPFTVRVVEFSQTGTPSPIPGATVAGAGASAQTGADGTATLTLAARGPAALVASMPGHARSSAASVCVTDGADGACGTTAAPPATVVDVACQTTGDDGRCGTVDRRAPRAKILSIREGSTFPRRRAPRLLAGTVTPDPSGLADVRLRLTRRDGARCETYDERTERFRSMRRCGAARGRWFSIGDRQDWSYLLPSRPRRGRYVLDVEARDRAGNRDTLLQRTRTRVVFRVR